MRPCMQSRACRLVHAGPAHAGPCMQARACTPTRMQSYVHARRPVHATPAAPAPHATHAAPRARVQGLARSDFPPTPAGTTDYAAAREAFRAEQSRKRQAWVESAIRSGGCSRMITLPPAVLPNVGSDLAARDAAQDAARVGGELSSGLSSAASSPVSSPVPSLVPLALLPCSVDGVDAALLLRGSHCGSSNASRIELQAEQPCSQPRPQP